ncbi:hypothetical protein [Thermoanaerobacterium thermosaccharolyticum]|nr:hypothetical protein [Thermoanaerobacterium thermosaccharolyticum]
MALKAGIEWHLALKNYDYVTITFFLMRKSGVPGQRLVLKIVLRNIYFVN